MTLQTQIRLPFGAFFLAAAGEICAAVALPIRGLPSKLDSRGLRMARVHSHVDVGAFHGRRRGTGQALLSGLVSLAFRVYQEPGTATAPSTLRIDRVMRFSKQ